MLCFYAIQPSFYETIKKHPAFVDHLVQMEEQQRKHIQIEIDVETLRESALRFFQKDIEQEDQHLFYDHFLKSRIYMVTVKNGAVYLDDRQNPFYQLLKRKYRWHILQEYDK